MGCGDLDAAFRSVSQELNPMSEYLVTGGVADSRFDIPGVYDSALGFWADDVEPLFGDGARGLAFIPWSTSCGACDKSIERGARRILDKLAFWPRIIAGFPHVVLKNISSFGFVSKVCVH